MIRRTVWIAGMGIASLLASACDTSEPVDHRAATAAPATAPANAHSDSQLAKLAALRHLVGEQPLAADRDVYAAYQIKDTPEEAERLADALRAELPGSGPPIVSAGAGETYFRKGRAMDRATGKPVKVFQARVVEPPAAGNDGANTAPGVEVRAWWRSGRLAGRAYLYQLRKAGSKWEVVSRAVESP